MSNFKKLLTLVFCIVLLVALLLCIIPIPGKVNMTLQGYAVNASGEITDEITITAEGKFRNYLIVQDEMYANMTIAFASGSTVQAESAGPFLQLNDDVIVCRLSYLAGDSQQFDGGYMGFSQDRNHFILEGMTDGSYYVASTDESRDASALLSFFSAFTDRD